MNKPVISEEQKISWERADEETADFLDRILDNDLDVEEFKVLVPHDNKELSFSELLTKVNTKLVMPIYEAAMKEFFMSLPRRFEIIKKDIRFELKKLLTKSEEVYSYLENLESYAKSLESENVDLMNEAQLLKSKLVEKEMEFENVLIKAQRVALEELTRELQQKNVVVPKEEEVVPPVEQPVSKPKIVKKSEEEDIFGA